MKIFVPKYYNEFKCIADKCHDSCCVGWEIEIDAVTLEKYRSLTGPFSDELKASINMKNPPSFRCDSYGRCKNLSDVGLCKIITNLGEDNLCQICRDHPRYFSFSKNFPEGGLGLACEAAADIILSLSELPDTVISEHNCAEIIDEEISDILIFTREKMLEYLFENRDDVSVIAENLCLAADECEDMLFDEICGKGADHITKFSLKSLNSCHGKEDNLHSEMSFDVLDAFLSIEVMQTGFSDKIKTAIDAVRAGKLGFSAFLNGVGKSYFRNLLYYFLHRYFLSAEADAKEAVRLSLASSFMICAIVFSEGDTSHDAFVIAAKDFSKNVEYSTCNIEVLLSEMLRFE